DGLQHGASPSPAGHTIIDAWSRGSAACSELPGTIPPDATRAMCPVAQFPATLPAASATQPLRGKPGGSEVFRVYSLRALASRCAGRRRRRTAAPSSTATVKPAASRSPEPNGGRFFVASFGPTGTMAGDGQGLPVYILAVSQLSTGSCSF